MKTFLAVVLGVVVGVGGMLGYQAYESHVENAALEAAFENIDENTKTFMRCMGMAGQ